MGDFESRASDPQLWLSTARQLLAAAETLNRLLIESMNEHSEEWRERQVGTLRATMLLEGLAVENALKALAISRGEIVVKDGIFHVTGVFGSHNVAGMAMRLKVFRDAKSQDLLRRLSDAVMWAAKYPVPLRELQLPKGASLKLIPTDTKAVASMLRELESCVPAV